MGHPQAACCQVDAICVLGLGISGRGFRWLAFAFSVFGSVFRRLAEHSGSARAIGALRTTNGGGFGNISANTWGGRRPLVSPFNSYLRLPAETAGFNSERCCPSTGLATCLSSGEDGNSMARWKGNARKGREFTKLSPSTVVFPHCCWAACRSWYKLPRLIVCQRARSVSAYCASSSGSSHASAKSASPRPPIWMCSPHASASHGRECPPAATS